MAVIKISVPDEAADQIEDLCQILGRVAERGPASLEDVSEMLKAAWLAIELGEKFDISAGQVVASNRLRRLFGRASGYDQGTDDSHCSLARKSGAIG